MNQIVFADNLAFLTTLPEGSVNLVYIDPPFNTGKTRRYRRLETRRSGKAGNRIGFLGKSYATTERSVTTYSDIHSDYLGSLEPRLREAHRVLAEDGSLFFHIDYREAHYCKILLDEIFGRESFMNEIIWAYDYGARSRKRWSPKHDTIFWYAKSPVRYTFNFEEMDRIPYMAPGLVTPEKRKRGKTPTDVWWHTIVPTNGKERTGYATQKPLGILKRIVKVHSRPEETVLDFYAGSGTTGEAAARLGRRFILVDNNPQAIEVMCHRLRFASPVLVNLHNRPVGKEKGNLPLFREWNQSLPPFPPPNAANSASPPKTASTRKKRKSPSVTRRKESENREVREERDA
ncbi:MAG: site-specific DNA-methyltransferase [Candidatus Hydrogenedentota bacterium]|nr:MAG: site-specific DNA-methyltransferase [Candidatus Hydrogenedentota bacterium]